MRRRLVQLQRRRHLPRGFVFKEPQHDGVAVGLAQPSHGFIQQRCDLFPGRRFRFGQDGLHISLLLAALAADFALHKVGRRQPRRLIQPAGQHRAAPQPAGFARQNDEDGLGDFLGVMRIAGETPGGRMDEVYIPRDQDGKCRFGSGAGIFREQFMVIQFGHLPIRCPRTAKLDKLFHIFHHEHFDGLVGGNQFQAEFAERLVHCIPIVILQVVFRAIQIKIET